MPRNPEWVQPKSYDRLKIEFKIPDEVLERQVGNRRKVKEKPGGKDKDKPVKEPQTHQEKEKERGKELEKWQDPGQGKKRKTPPPKQNQPKDDQPTGGKEVVKREEPPPGPGKDVVPRRADTGPVPPIWGGRWEVVRPPGIGGPVQARQHPGQERIGLPGRGPGPRALPADTPAGVMERRQSALADLVQQSMSTSKPKEYDARGNTIHTGEIVGESHPIPVQPGRGAIGGNQFRALGPGVVDSTTTAPIDRTGPRRGDTREIPKIQTDITTELNPVRSGDTKPIPIVEPKTHQTLEGKIIPPAKQPSGQDLINTREFPVIKGELHQEAIGARQRQPFAMASPRAIGGPQRATQLTLFGGPAEEHPEPLAAAQAGREERRAITPPSMPPGRQVHFMRTNLPKKPGSQGTLFQTVQFKK